MEKQHLTYFKIENFKRFDSFEMSNLGQFNLIVGDNNVGKTSVLEGLLFDEDLDQLMMNFWFSIGIRHFFDIKLVQSPNVQFAKNITFWQFLFKTISEPISCTLGSELNFETHTLAISEFKDIDPNIQEAIRQISSSVSISDWANLVNQRTKFYQIRGAYFESLRSEHSKLNIPFTPANVGSNQNLVNNFFDGINANKEARKAIEGELRSFISNLEELRIHRQNNFDIIGVELADRNGIYPITQYGDGTVKFTRFLIEIVLSQGKRLMVDEIGAGIHFTRLVSYWKTIIQLCDKYKVQLFATTHSLECQQAFIEALEAPDMQQYQKDARNISLIENQEGEVKAITFDFKQFEYALNIGFNTRGGIR